MANLPLKCNYLDYVDSQYINKTWTYYNCSKDLSTFTAINDFELYPDFSDKNYYNSDLSECLLDLKPPNAFSHLFNEFSSFSNINNAPQNIIKNNTPQNIINSTYYDIDQMQTL